MDIINIDVDINRWDAIELDIEMIPEFELNIETSPPDIEVDIQTSDDYVVEL